MGDGEGGNVMELDGVKGKWVGGGENGIKEERGE